MKRVLVTGAAGFIGHHLVTLLKGEGYWVRGVDIRPLEYSTSDADEFEICDLRRIEDCQRATRAVHHVYALAADMGGIGFISSNHATILRNNTLINTHTLDAARENGVERYLYTSSACIYPQHLQLEAAGPVPLKEEDAYPADPQGAYGWEKLVAERACLYYAEEYGLQTRVARLDSVYGPIGAYNGGREKAPAALCRKVAAVDSGGTIQIWGDGQQSRSYCYVEDCAEALHLLMQSDHREPTNLGHHRVVAINDLARIIVRLSGKRDIRLEHVEGPQGVRGRTLDSGRLRAAIGWEPETSLEAGLDATYRWVEEKVRGAPTTPTRDQVADWPVQR